MRRLVFELIVLTAGLCSAVSVAQTLKRPPAATHQQKEDMPASQNVSESVGAEPMAIPMSVGVGTPIKVAIDSDVRVRKVGQAIRCRTTEPVYAFDKLLIPVGTVVNGKVSAIDSVPKMVRTMQAANGNFSHLGRCMCSSTNWSWVMGGVCPCKRWLLLLRMECCGLCRRRKSQNRKTRCRMQLPNKVSATRQAIRQKWNDLQNQIHEPGKMHKVKRIVLAQLPVHPQYIDAGTSFNADLLQPLDFGIEAVKPARLTDIGSPPPNGSVVHARLVTALSSSTAKQGDLVEALITEPLVISDHLILPEGSVIKGSVLQAQPARRMGRNGRLRILFHRPGLVPATAPARRHAADRRPR